MNARQKAKHYKKLYERMQKQPINLQVHNVNTNIIQACTLVPYEMMKVIQESEDMELIKNKLAREIANGLKETMDIKIVDYPPQCIYKVYGTVRVVTGISL